MIRRLTRACFQMSAGKKIPRPRDPSVSESFETKLSDEQLKILIDPKGFMSEEEKAYEKNNTVDTETTSKAQQQQ